MRTQRKNSENRWKTKAIERGNQARALRQELKRQKYRAEQWRSRYYGLKEEKKISQVKYHSYPLELIWLAVWMNTMYNISLRGVSKSILKLCELYGVAKQSMSPVTIRNWCLKFGFKCLNSSIEKGKYVLILDESIEINREQLLLLLVVPIEKHSPICPLCMEDVKVLHLSVQESWKAKEIADIIDNKITEHGIEIEYGISDKCSTLRKSLKISGLNWVGDCTHEIANIVKAIFLKHKSFNKYIKDMNLLRSKWILSKHNLYVPPQLRSKSRFHQILQMHKWGYHILDRWEKLPPEAIQELSFVQQSSYLLKTMKDMYGLIDTFSKIFKYRGIQNNSMIQWAEAVQKYQYENEKNIPIEIEQFISKINIYLEKQRVTIGQDRQILCCSDIIESIFGKYKNKGGAKIITEDALKIAAFCKKKELMDVKTALEGVKMVDLLKWKEENTIVSKLALRKREKKKDAA